MRNKLIIILLLTVSGVCSSQTLFRHGVFYHHSTGGNIWGLSTRGWGNNTLPSDWTGTKNVPNEIHNYNVSHGLTGVDSFKFVERWFPYGRFLNVNEWYLWDSAFTVGNLAGVRIVDSLPLYNIIMIKTCFPASDMTTATLWGQASDTLTPTYKSNYNYKWHWRRIINVMKSHPDKFFVIWTNPPPAFGTPTNGAPSTYQQARGLRSHYFSKWAKDTLAAGLDAKFGAFPKNVYVFDIFHKYENPAWHVADTIYTRTTADAHPNGACTDLVAPQLVQEVLDAVITFESTSSLPQVPILGRPVNGAQLSWSSPRLSWSRCGRALNYYLQVSEDSLFGSTLINDSTLVDTSKLIGPLANQTKYFWRVRSKNLSGSSSWSAYWNFRILVPPADPALLFPPDGLTDQPNVSVFRWNNCASASNYCVQASSDSLFETLVLDDSTITDTLRYFGPFDNLKKYFWRVKSINSAGSSNWSNRWSFTTSAYTFQYSLNNGWNLISLPLVVGDHRTTRLYSNSSSPAFGYDQIYRSEDTMKQGEGYWMKFDHDGLWGITGVPVVDETVDIVAGWNLIGSIGVPIPVASIASQPAGIVTSEFFGYGRGYATSDTILPGKGYWVKTNQAGKLILAAPGLYEASACINIVHTAELPPNEPGNFSRYSNPRPDKYILSQNYPNPFNPTTEIRFTIVDSRFTTLKVYDMLGQVVATLVNEVKEPGEYSVQWDPSALGGLPSGIYFYKLQIGDFTDVKKMLLLK